MKEKKVTPYKIKGGITTKANNKTLTQDERFMVLNGNNSNTNF